jgi:hypothetical protein
MGLKTNHSLPLASPADDGFSALAIIDSGACWKRKLYGREMILTFDDQKGAQL